MLNSLPKFWMFLLIPLLGFINPGPLPSDNFLKGAWGLVEVNGEEVGRQAQTVRIFSNTYTMATTYDQENKTFISSRGGPYSLEGKKVSLTIDYHTIDTAQVGQTYSYKISINADDILTVKGANPAGEKINQKWRRLDNGDAPLAGAWQITQRMGRDGAMREITPGVRKTVKILSGTRFQWTAMNTETKEFLGCGGGAYTFENGVYTENIEFFSRDSSRVGMSLSFEGKVEGDDWHHSGKSSLGRPIQEVWSRD